MRVSPERRQELREYGRGLMHSPSGRSQELIDLIDDLEDAEAEVLKLRSQITGTGRTTVEVSRAYHSRGASMITPPEGQKTPVLDHGYVQLIEHYGSDESIIEAARMSTDKGFVGWGPIHSDDCKRHKAGTSKQVHAEACCDGKAGDEKLLRYLRENRHTTPFEMAGCIIEVQAPIMVFREWHRHRTQSYNELSARYTPLPDMNYIPTVDRLMLNSKTNKQAGVIKGADELTEENARSFQDGLRLMYHNQEQLYQTALGNGVPKELARVHLPVGRYSRMRANANLKNWLDFMTLRSDFTESGKKAQWEIRQFANEVGKVIAGLFPRTWELFIGVGR